MYKLIKAPEFEEWYDNQPLKSKLQIDDRLLHIVEDGHFGIHKDLTEEISELKWDNGILRVIQKLGNAKEAPRF